MPIRFQVDPDFYDHPKVTGMSDAGFSLWVRAGSFSAAKLTDGFVSEDVLVYTLRSSSDVAGELVHRGLWRRVKGGYRFHEWSERNLTKQRVDADREADRERKRALRYGSGVTAGPVTCYGCGSEFVTAKPNTKYCSASCKQKAYRDRSAASEQVVTGVVRPDSGRNPEGIQAESERIPVSSVSVSVSESVSGSGRGDGGPETAAAPLGPKPPSTCRDHRDDPDPPACRRCKEAREAGDRWEAERARRVREAPQCRKHPGSLAHNCGGCRADRLAGDA